MTRKWKILLASVVAVATLGALWLGYGKWMEIRDRDLHTEPFPGPGLSGAVQVDSVKSATGVAVSNLADTSAKPSRASGKDSGAIGDSGKVAGGASKLSEEEAEKLATELVIRDQQLTYNPKTEDYTPKGKSYTVLIMPQGFDEKGRYEIRLCPKDSPLSVYDYCFVDLEKRTVVEE